MTVFMKKKVFALLLALTLIMPITIVAQESPKTQLNTFKTKTESIKESGLLDYTDYKKQYNNVKNSTQNVKVDTDACISVKGAVNKKSYQSESVVYFPDDKGSAEWEFSVPETAFYRIGITYFTLEGRENDPVISLGFDGEISYSELESVKLSRWFKNDTNEKISGSEIIPEQIEVFDWFKTYISDSVGFIQEDLTICLTKGKHTITITNLEETFYIREISFEIPTVIKTYEEVSMGYKAESGNGCISIEGEDAYLKSSSSLTPKYDNSSVNLSPSDHIRDVINYIGSTNWKQNGDTIKWDINVEKSGYYTLGMRYRQSYVLNGISYRRLEIDGEVPFSEAAQIGFKYSPNWEYTVFSNEKNEPYYFELSEGRHTISLTVTLGPMASINYRLSEITSELGQLYRKITQITGETPDSNRDYDLFNNISGMEETLTHCKSSLQDIANEISDITGKRSDSNISVIRNMANVLDRMLKKPHFAADYKKDFFNNYCSVGSLVAEMRDMALDIDQMYLYTENSVPQDVEKGFLSQFIFSVKRFIASFSEDYNSLSTAMGDDLPEISIWVNWGRDQAQVLNNIIAESFTPQHNIAVKVKIVNASLIQAVLSNNSPDLSLRLSRSQPVNLAVRNALYDLTEFDDYDDVSSRFMDGATIPYTYEGGVYALPDTQLFYMLFYRKDIFAELGVSVPNTWNDFLRVGTIINRNNMLVGIPYDSNSQETNSGVGSVSLFPTILLQNGGKMYSEDLKATTLAEPISLNSFSFWCKLYTDYKFPVSYNFFNRFRTGEMPMAIADYTQYTRLTAAAPEISGLWSIALMPGIEKEDGTINRVETGGGTGSAILNKSQHKQEAWEFLKWWTSADTQVKYSRNLESLLGPVERQATANVDALKKMSWNREDAKILMEQWGAVEEIPEVVGGYYTMRAIDQAFWRVYNQNKDAGDSITTQGKKVDAEITRKRSEYGLS